VSRIYRLLHVIDHLEVGGAQETLLSLINYLDRQRFHLEVAALHGHGFYWEIFRQLAVPVHSLSPHKYLPLYFPNLFLLLKRRKFDLIHCRLTASNLIAKPLAAILGVPFIFNYDYNDINRKRHKPLLLLDRLANRITNHIVVDAATTRDFLIGQEKIPAEKITLIYNGVDLRRFQPAINPAIRAIWRHKWGLPENTPVVAGVGRLRRQKNFPLFLKVARQVLQDLPEAYFIIAGEGPERKDLERLAGELGIATRVHFLGHVADLTQLYPAVDVLLMTSLSEGTPLTVLEAMAMGVPIVAAQVDGMAEILEDEVDAYLVPVGDSSMFARRTRRLLQDKSIAQQFVQSGLEKVRTHYSAASMVQQVEEIYLHYLQARSITYSQ
jgi:glycosyltransferase involved in cell wall biosynthesis